MHSTNLFKAGLLDQPGRSKSLIRRLNHQAKRRDMAHPDPVLMDERETHRRIERRLAQFAKG